MEEINVAYRNNRLEFRRGEKVDVLGDVRRFTIDESPNVGRTLKVYGPETEGNDDAIGSLMKDGCVREYGLIEGEEDGV